MHPALPTATDISLSLIMPALNECEGIARSIAEADFALQHIASDYEIIVVDDGSTDGTRDIVQAIAKTNAAVRLVRHPVNQGYGAALRTGFSTATKSLVVFTDADGQFDLRELDRFVLLSAQYDIVCGYRIDRKDTPLRCFYSQVYNLLVRVLLRTGVRDVDCALKMFRRDVVQCLKISGSGFLVNSEILTQAHQQGFSVVEVGVSHRPRTLGTSTVSIAHIPKVLKSLANYWWNEVQFPSIDASRATNNVLPHGVQASFLTSKQAQWLQIAFLFIAAFFLFTNLDYPLIDRDETRYAEIPREMLATGNWILPQLNFETYYDKPPMLYWLCAVSYKTFGVSEAAARYVPAGAALLVILATMWFASRTLGKQVGLLAGIVLLFSAGFTFTSRYLLLDGVLTLFVSLSLFSAYEAIRNRRLHVGWWTFSAVCCGLAFLTKGPLAIVLWLPPVFAFSWLSNDCVKLRWWHYCFTGLVVIGVVTPWLVAVHLQDAEFLREFFYKHNLRRFAGDFHERPWWYFIPVILVAGHPWSFLTIPYVNFLTSVKGDARFYRPPAIGFLLLWSAWAFAFFSLSSCKLPTYLLPMAPAIAIMLAHYVNHVLCASPENQRFSFARKWSPRAAAITTSAAGLGFSAYTFVTSLYAGPDQFAWVVVWGILLIISVALVRSREKVSLSWTGSAFGIVFLAVMLMHHTVPAYSRSQTLLGAKTKFRDELEKIGDGSIATISHEFSEIPFYMGRSDIPNFSSSDRKQLKEYVNQRQHALLVVRRHLTNDQLEEMLPAGTLFHLRSERAGARLIEIQRPDPTAAIATRAREAYQK
jgi:4-amino-4-deoxy-L-arabinose transferase-like glycosyltransferase